MTFESRHIGNRKSGGGNMLRMILMIAILFAIVLVIRKFVSVESPSEKSMLKSEGNEQGFWPKIRGEEVHHSTFMLDYNEGSEQPNWVAYILTKDELDRPSVGRTDWFEKDTTVSTGSAEFYDYKNSGYTKGHLVPSADRVWNRKVNEETFLMSNISPQKYYFNGGIWRELEENVRDWARIHHRLYIVTGPVLSKGGERETIGKNGVEVPNAFFKVILEMGNPGINAIGFIIPNEKSDRKLEEYALTIDEVEDELGYNFYSNLFDADLEIKIESGIKISNWNFDQDRYRERINIWNKR